MDQLAKHSWSHICYSPFITSGSAIRAQLVTLLLLSTHNPLISWQTTSGHTSVTFHSSPLGQLAENSRSHFCYFPLITYSSARRVFIYTDYFWSHFCYSLLITRGSAGRVLLVTLRLLSTHHPLISWQSTAGHTSVTLHSSPVDQLAEPSWSHLLSTHHPWISLQSTAGHTSADHHSSPVDQLAEHSWSHFCYCPLFTSGSAGRVQLVTFLLLSSYHPWISWQSTAGHTAITLQSSPECLLAKHTSHTSVTLNSTPVCQLAENSWLHFCYSPLITRGSAGRVQLVTLLLLSNHHQLIGWQSTADHTSVTLHSSPVDQLAG